MIQYKIYILNSMAVYLRSFPLGINRVFIFIYTYRFMGNFQVFLFGIRINI